MRIIVLLAICLVVFAAILVFVLLLDLMFRKQSRGSGGDAGDFGGFGCGGDGDGGGD